MYVALGNHSFILLAKGLVGGVNETVALVGVQQGKAALLYHQLL
jgi:hypothetical protein